MNWGVTGLLILFGAFVLLLIITIVIVGFSFTIFQDVASTAGDRPVNVGCDTHIEVSNLIKLSPWLLTT